MSKAVKASLAVLGAILVILAAVYFFRDDAPILGEPTTGDRRPDWSTVERNADGELKDDDGFIPLSEDGGPVYMTMLYAEDGERRMNERTCEAAHWLNVTRSRENRADMHELVKMMTVEYGKLPEMEERTADIYDAARELRGFGLNDPSIGTLLDACGDLAGPNPGRGSEHEGAHSHAH